MRFDRSLPLLRRLHVLVPITVVLITWELLARTGRFNPVLFPTVERIGQAWFSMLSSGILWLHIKWTFLRLGVGFAAASVVGVGIGMLMAFIRSIERFFVPISTILLPIPALAWVPVLILWFGLGNRSTVVLVFFTAAIPIMLTTWTGVKQIPEQFLRAAQTMGCSGHRLLVRVTLPAALPSIVTGLRLGLGQAWRAVVAGEMIGATDYGLGFAIFAAREFLRSDIMLAVIGTISAVGLLLEFLCFGAVEKWTVERWGMVRQ